MCAARLAFTSSSRVLDVGCGCGTVLRDIGAGSPGCRLLVVAGAVGSKAIPAGRVQHSEANAFEVAEGEFDAVLSFGVMQYLPDRA